MSDKPLWIPHPDRVAASQVSGLMREVSSRFGVRLSSYRDLHTWTIANPDQFWGLLWDTCGVIGDKGSRLVADAGKMPGAKFLPDARLNFAENLLRRADDGEALVFRGEDKASARMTWRELNGLVSRLQ
jgi:acetoacetyl-CoA synthetase